MTSVMDRRTFMGTLAGGLLAAPLAAEAQQPARPATIGVLASAEFTEAVRGAIRDGLRDQGYVEGQNIVIEWRSAEGRSDRAAALAVELAHLKVDVIGTRARRTAGGPPPSPASAAAPRKASRCSATT
ncbi:MAG TPA: hypothetical protein VGA58_04065 [bacterium]